MNVLMKLAVTAGLSGLIIMLIACIFGALTVGMATLQFIAIISIICGAVLLALGLISAALWIILDVWSN